MCKAFGIVAVLLVASASGLAVDSSLTSSLQFDEEAAKNRPVSKVITLLKDMLAQLEKEGDEDEEVYDAIVCWCETNEKEKTKAIEDGKQKISDLTKEIEELTAKSQQLTAELKKLKEEVDQSQQALSGSQNIRMKGLGEFNSEEKDLLNAIKALNSAIIVLSKHHTNSLLQLPAGGDTQMMSVAAVLQHQMQTHADLLRDVLTPSQRRSVTTFIQQPDYWDATPTFKQSYAPQSGEIIGILKQMKETFEQNLSASQKEEMASQKGYEDTKAAKEDEIAAAADAIDKKVQELADTDEALANAKQDLEDTEAKLAADEAFLEKLKEHCAMTDQMWEERSKTRAMEMEAVSKALAILSSDDAHDLFTRTFNFAQVQMESVSQRQRRIQAVKLLRKAFSNLPRAGLATLMTQIRLDAFTKVKKAIDDMIAQLVKEKEDEIKHKDFCVAELNANQLQTEDKEREKADLEEKIDVLKHTIKVLGEEIEALKAEIAEMQVQMKRAGEDREKENKEFQLTVADQQATIHLLNKALEVLKGFYESKSALVQQEPEAFAPPPGFKDYQKNAQSGGVMGMIQQIINDSKAMMNEAIRGEADAQTAYEDFVKDSNASIFEAEKSIVAKTEEKAKAEVELTEKEKMLEDVVAELEQLADYKQQLHTSCDFVLKNFEIRQTARDEEILALKQAKQILSGAKFNALMQEYTNQDATNPAASGDLDLLPDIGAMALDQALTVPK